MPRTQQQTQVSLFGRCYNSGESRGAITTLKPVMEARRVVVNHCIIHQENLCNKALNAIDLMKVVLFTVSSAFVPED